MRGAAKASSVRRCARGGCGAVSAQVRRVRRLILGIVSLLNYFCVRNYIGGNKA